MSSKRGILPKTDVSSVSKFKIEKQYNYNINPSISKGLPEDRTNVRSTECSKQRVGYK